MAIVYQHRRNDTKEIFYIGIGKDYRRMSHKHGRNNYWNNIVSKYGRIDLKTGCLVNMTRGGEGCPSRQFEYSDPYNFNQLKSIITYFHPRNNVNKINE